MFCDFFPVASQTKWNVCHKVIKRKRNSISRELFCSSRTLLGFWGADPKLNDLVWRFFIFRHVPHILYSFHAKFINLFDSDQQQYP